MNLEAMRRRPARPYADWLLPTVLSTTAGAADVIGFLALGGLLTAHITGNVVVLAAHYATGGFSQAGPLLSVPVFIAVLGIVTSVFPDHSPGARRGLLWLHAALVTAFFGFGAGLGPFTNPESGIAVFVGMLGVTAMAMQSALVKLEMPGFPSTTVVTTNTTQLAADLALLARGRKDGPSRAGALRRVRLTLPTVAGFAIGCGVGAFLEAHVGLWALALPVILAAGAVLLGSGQ